MIDVKRGRNYEKKEEPTPEEIEAILSRRDGDTKIGRPSKRPPEDVLKELYGKYTAKQIASIYHVNIRTVMNWLDAYRCDNALTTEEAIDILAYIRDRYPAGSKKANALNMAIESLKNGK